jgi:ATP-binding cassette subfamily F protein uup
MVMAGDGVIEEYVGGYSDYLRQRRPAAPPAAVPASKASASKASVPAEAKKKLSYKDARELEQLPLKIEQLETQLAGFSAQMQQADFYQQGAEKITAHGKRMESAQAELDAAYARWTVLDA